MTSGSYLVELIVRLATGLEKVSPARRDAHLQWYLGQQQPNGGFTGREGGSDLYYSAFAVRAIGVLGGLSDPCAKEVAAYLQAAKQQDASVIDLISLVLAARQLELAVGRQVLPERGPWVDRLIAKLESLRTGDGGYAKSAEGRAGSTYQTFLTLLAYELLNVEPAQPQAAIDFLRSQRRDDGGYVEIRAMRRSGVNPTAAAVAALQILNAAPADVEDLVDFIADLQNDEGGFCANTRIPAADLLSTFTALQTLQQLQRLEAVDLLAVQQFVLALEQPTGGFLAAAWDDVADVEYTFYGLAALSLTQN